jgi:hypothetical protein
VIVDVRVLVDVIVDMHVLVDVDGIWFTIRLL